jgi:hypothetical protein
LLTGRQPLLQDDCTKGRGEQSGVGQDAPEAVVDDPGQQGEVKLQVAVGAHEHSGDLTVG